MVTSRFNPDIADEFKKAIILEVRASADDIKRYVAGQLHRLPRCVQRTPVLQDLMQEKIAEAADGM